MPKPTIAPLFELGETTQEEHTSRSQRAGIAIVILLAVALAGVVLRTNGSLMASGAFLAVVIVVAATIYRIEWGFYLLLLSVLVFGQFEVPGFTTRTFRVGYFKNVKEIEYLPYFSRGDANAFELHFFFLLAVWLIRYIVRRDIKLKPVPLWGASAAWFVWIVIAFVYGMQRGGEFLPALWETRAVAYLSIMSAFVPQVIQTREQITNVMWVSIIGITVKAFEGINRYIENGWSSGGYEAMQAHEDPVFIAGLLMFLLALLVFGGNKWQLRTIVILLLPLLLGFQVGKRRAAYAALVVSFAVFEVVIPRRSFVRGLKVVVPLVFLVATYVAVFWNSSSPLAGPINEFRSGLQKDVKDGDEVVKDRDYYSNLYRKIEDYDLAITIQNSTLMGIGFGTRYEQPIALVHLDFALRDYMAHNNVLWLLTKSGAIGFFLFWFLLNGLGFKGSSMIARLDDPYLKAVCALSIVGLISLMTAAYFDLHLVRYRTMIYTGILIGLLGSIESIERGLGHDLRRDLKAAE
jgi:hypothetical protein